MLGWVGLITACGTSPPANLIGANLQSTAPVTVGDSVSIPMPVRRLQFGSASLRLLGLPVAVGSKSTELLLDTGSSGLRIFAEVAPGVTRTGIPNRAEFGDGTVYEGELALASVLIGPVPTEEPILIQVVDRVGCIPEAPNCPGRDGSQLFTQSGFFGILGISLGARTSSLDLYSPLTRLPGNLDSGYLIETRGFAAQLGEFTVGLTPQNQQGFRQGGLSQIGAGSPGLLEFPDGTPAWDDASLRSFYTVVPLQGPALFSQDPAPTLFDTGSSDISLEVLGSDPTFQILPSGSQFRATFPSLFNLEFTVGSPITPSSDRVFIKQVPQDPLQILGMPFFFRYDTLFDIEQGRIGFRAR